MSLRENLMSWGKYKKVQTFSVPVEKEVTKTDKEGNENIITISCKIKSIDSARFMATLLSNLVDNIAKEIHKNAFKDRDCFVNMKVLRAI